MNVLLVGTGYMGKEYTKVLKAQNIEPLVICRTDSSAQKFENEFRLKPISGGVDKALKTVKDTPSKAIVAVNVDQLSAVTISLLQFGIKEILVEKPAGLNRNEIQNVEKMAREYNARVYVAYNRRFYSSTEKAIEIIEQDGGVSSFNFEFTEWSSTIEKTGHSPKIKEEWLLANSSHVIDLAFYLGGQPTAFSSYRLGSLNWHSRASVYVGAGITDKGALFSYQANWDAPGRWSVEILTNKHRLYFRPMEKLAIQDKGTVKIEEIEIDDKLDIDFKPGLYKQVESFLSDSPDKHLLLIKDQLKHMDIYEQIDGLR